MVGWVPGGNTSLHEGAPPDTWEQGEGVIYRAGYWFDHSCDPA